MDRREREKSRYKRGMAAKNAVEANRKAAEMFTSTALKLPKGAKTIQIKSDKAQRFDILPYEVGKGNPFADEGSFHFERTFWVHRGVGADNRTYCCPNKISNGKQPCPICEEARKVQDDEELSQDEKTKLLNTLRAKRRQLFNVVDTNEPEKGVQIWDFSYALFGEKLLDMLEDEEFAEDRRNFCEFEGGKTLRLKFKKEKMGKAEFYDVTDIAFLDRKEDYDPDKMLKQVHCLDDCVKVLSYDELKQIFLQSGEKESKPQFRRSDLKRIDDMTDKDLNKFIAMNDIELDTDNFETTEELAEAVKEEVRKALDAEAGEEEAEEDEPKAKKGKKDTGKGKKKSKKDEDEDEPEEAEEEAEESEDEDDSEDEEAEDEADESEDEDEDEAPEIEKGSNVTWTDEDDDEHEGEVIKIKKDKATVKEGKKTFEVDLSDLTLA